MGAIGRDEVLRGVAASTVAFWLLRKLARDIGREVERLGRQTRSDMESSKVLDAAMAMLHAEGDLLLHNTSAHMQDLVASSRFHCKLGHGASFFCEIEPKPPEGSTSLPPPLNGNQ